MVPVTAVCWVLLLTGALITRGRLGQIKLVAGDAAYLAIAAFVAYGRFAVEPLLQLTRNPCASSGSRASIRANHTVASLPHDQANTMDRVTTVSAPEPFVTDPQRSLVLAAIAHEQRSGADRGGG